MTCGVRGNPPVPKSSKLQPDAARKTVMGTMPAADCASAVIDLLHAREVVHPTLQRKTK